MSAEVFNLQAVIALNISEFEAELNKAKRSFSSAFDNVQARTPAPEVTQPDGKPIKNFIDETKGKVANMAENVVTSLKQLPSKIGSAFKNLAGTIGNCLAEIPAKAKEIIGKAGEIVRNLAENVSTTAVNVIKGSVSAGMDFDSSMSQVAATMGKTVNEVSDLRAFAQEMGRATAFSATESANALNFMALAGYDAETSMQMLPNVLNLAAAGGIELATASDMITDSQSALGLSLDETSVLVDEMAAASSNSNTSVAQLGEAILTIGGTAKKLRGGTTELSTLLGLLANNGIKGAEGGTALRNMMNSLISPTADASAMLENLGISLYDSEGNMRSLNDVFLDLKSGMDGMATQAERDQVLTTLFNARDLKSVEAILSGVGDGYDDLSRKIANSAGAAQKMADVQLDNLAGDVTLFQSALEGVQIAISDRLTPVLRDGVQTATKGLEKVSLALQETDFGTAMSRLTELIQPVISEAIQKFLGYVPKIFGVVSAVLKAVRQALLKNLPMLAEMGLQMLTSLANGISANAGNAIKAFAGVLEKGYNWLKNASQQLISAGMEMVVAIGKGISGNADGISLYIAEIVAFFADGIAKTLPALANTALQIVGVICNGIATALPKLAESAGQIIVQIGSTISERFPEVLGKFTETFGQVLQAFNEFLPEILATGGEIVGAVISGIIDSLPMLVDSALQIVKTIAEFLGESLPEIVPAVVGIVVEIVNTLTNPKTLGTLIDAALAIIVGLAQGIINSLPELIKRVPEIVDNIVTTIVENVPKLLTAAIEIIATLADSLINPENLKLILEAGVKILMSLVSGIVSVYGELAGVAVGILGEIKANLGDLYESGVDMIKSFVDGIKAKAGDVIDAVKDIASLVTGFLGFSEPDEGPLSNFHTFAPDMINLFTKGIRDNKKLIFGETENIAETIKSTLGDISPKVRCSTDKIDTCQLDEVEQLDREFSTDFSVIPDKIDTCQLDEVGQQLDREFSADFSVIPDKIDTRQLSEGVSFEKPDFPIFSNTSDYVIKANSDRFFGENSNSTTVENLNITIEGGLRLSSDYETEKFIDAVAERLQARRIRIMRATGGVNV